MEVQKAYNARDYEDAMYKKWEDSGLFSPRIIEGKKPFTIMMPPPNATGTLHLGHAVMLALEDIMIRYHRMRGDPTLWLPGTDHAAIATQNKVEKLLLEEGITRQMLGREAFLKKVHEYVAQSQDIIRNQVRKMGSSCDWSRERYTFAPELTPVIREMFVRMFKGGLIYRGNRIVNWCPRCESTLADDEVKYKEEKSKLYYLKYGPFVIATARPETKFLDKVIVVHPDDKRYKKYVGKKLTVPWISGDVKANIIADPAADPEFGTGAMTITPAHDFIDFEIAQRHGIEIIKIIDEKGRLTEHASEFAGRVAREARADIIKKLEEKGLVEKIDEKYVHNISLCYRCDTPIEPLVSRQWFISVDTPFGAQKKTLKQRSLEAVRSKKITILPERFEKTYFHWMENLRDWCISRQIWFGHQIPVWYCECGEALAALEAPRECPKCHGDKLMQDPDTLDTWFSAGMWTFSTLGWPKPTEGLSYFHPTSVLETGYDILFFWVARMIIMTSYALSDIPFETVYLHGLVRTRTGDKMSKSKPETCIDPLDMIKKYGADALRLSMVIGATPGNDVRLYEEKIAGYRNFVNKIWNAARFALSVGAHAAAGEVNAKTHADKWILTRTQHIIQDTTRALEQFRFSDAGMRIYDFTWNEFCAWYLEISKGREQNVEVIGYVLETILKLLHPFVPFVTEVLWERIGQQRLLMGSDWPQPNRAWIYEKEAASMQDAIDIVTAIRAARAENSIEPGARIDAHIASPRAEEITHHLDTISSLARIQDLTIAQAPPAKMASIKQFVRDIEITIPAEGLINIAKETARLRKELEETENYVKSLTKKLANKQYLQNAPAEIVASDKKRLSEAELKCDKLKRQLKNLG